jgi:hypothetical protein
MRLTLVHSRGVGRAASPPGTPRPGAGRQSSRTALATVTGKSQSQTVQPVSARSTVPPVKRVPGGARLVVCRTFRSAGEGGRHGRGQHRPVARRTHKSCLEIPIVIAPTTANHTVSPRCRELEVGHGKPTIRTRQAISINCSSCHDQNWTPIRRQRSDQAGRVGAYDVHSTG